MPEKPHRIVREHEVIVWALNRALGRDFSPPPPEAWNSGIVELETSRLAPLVPHLLGSGIKDLPETPYRTIARAVGLARFASERTGLQLAEVAGLLEDRGMPWLALRGRPMATRLYPSPACRPSRDVKLLVPWGAIGSVTDRLRTAGYQASGKAERNNRHLRFRRPGVAGWDDLIDVRWELHPAPGNGRRTADILDSRRLWMGSDDPVWIPDAADERDLLVRHYVCLAGRQAILLLDLLLHLNGEVIEHPAGAVVADDLARLGLEPCVTGPSEWQLKPLRRWMSARTFAQRRNSPRPMAARLALPGPPPSWGDSMSRLREIRLPFNREGREGREGPPALFSWRTWRTSR